MERAVGRGGVPAPPAGRGGSLPPRAGGPPGERRPTAAASLLAEYRNRFRAASSDRGPYGRPPPDSPKLPVGVAEAVPGDRGVPVVTVPERAGASTRGTSVGVGDRANVRGVTESSGEAVPVGEGGRVAVAVAAGGGATPGMLRLNEGVAVGDAVAVGEGGARPPRRA